LDRLFSRYFCCSLSAPFYHSTNAPPSSSSTRCYQKDKRTNPWNLPKSSALSEIGQRLTAKHFHQLVCKRFNCGKSRFPFHLFCLQQQTMATGSVEQRLTIPINLATVPRYCTLLFIAADISTSRAARYLSYRLFIRLQNWYQATHVTGVPEKLPLMHGAEHPVRGRNHHFTATPNIAWSNCDLTLYRLP
jgi:hypothetical protein